MVARWLWFDANVVLRRCWRVSSTTEATASTSRQRHHGQTQPQTGLTRLQQERKRKVARKAAAKRRPRRLARGSAPSFQVRLHFQRNPSCMFAFLASDELVMVSRSESLASVGVGQERGGAAGAAAARAGHRCQGRQGRVGLRAQAREMAKVARGSLMVTVQLSEFTD